MIERVEDLQRHCTRSVRVSSAILCNITQQPRVGSRNQIPREAKVVEIASSVDVGFDISVIRRPWVGSIDRHHVHYPALELYLGKEYGQHDVSASPRSSLRL